METLPSGRKFLLVTRRWREVCVRLTQAALVGFRNLNTVVRLTSPLSVVIGANNAGKSNLIDALRMVLSPEGTPYERVYPKRDDFAWTPDDVSEFSVTVEFDLLTSQEQSHMLFCLTPSKGPGTAQL